ncbi:MAG: hypothetical protein IJ758_00260 [Clostridia bacterium]|nr:hypothetical protein [Clostridia bacterium]
MREFLKKLSVVIASCSVLIFSAACGCSINENASTDSDTNKEEKKIYSVGEAISMKNAEGEERFKVTVDSVSLTDERNQYTEKAPAQVIIIKYTYENVGSRSDVYYPSTCLKVTDEKGNECDKYPLSLNAYPKSISKGEKCTAKSAFGIEEPSTKVTISLKDSVLDAYSGDDAIVEADIAEKEK